MRLLALLPAVLLVGCRSGGDTLMPLGTGKVWQYQVTSGLTTAVQTVKVTGPTSVGPFAGWSVRGDGAESRLAWDGGRLFAGCLAGTSYRPPLPLVDADAKTWKGEADSGFGAKPMTATITNKKAKETVGSRPMDVTLVDVKFSNGDEALTWFAPGIGIVRQEQRREDRLVAKLVYLSGP